MKNPVVIFGAESLGRLALDIFASNDVLVYGFLDDDKKLHNTEISEVVILGDPMDDGFLKIIGNKTEAFVAIANKTHKEKIVKMLLERRKTMPVNAIHAKAVLSEDAEIGHGILLAAGAVVNQGAKIGNHTIILSNAVVDTQAEIGEYVEIGAGAIINSEAIIESGAFVGSGAIVVSGVTIGANARVGAGSVVIENVKEGATVFGNPAKAIGK
ncbi:acetyltransferase [Lacihabitans sp. LS3-19]|uniref:NeuD/PglB/VioB family sugar acetyltransferase n=1 Tax=Lacihabitans sp. LS3-19 TaxID=2487335 RepID=UPI0020CDA503|nr:NeuD/PglB/VioB family sugar acetyltransferase [Lacihabitans sp. LS3-19]MCP9767794.1 acetyltransferase [Lacihabitans sp. LS3-19]